MTAAAAATLMAAPLAVAAADPAWAGLQRDRPSGMTLHPARLARGESTPLFHTDGRVLVDGDRRIRLQQRQGRWVDPVGRSGRDYLVLTTSTDFGVWKLLRVDRAGDATVLAGGGEPVVEAAWASADGSHVALVRHGQARTRVTVRDSRTGALLRHRGFRGYLEPLDYGRRRMVLTQWPGERSRTFWWDPHDNRQVRISRRPGLAANVPANRVALHYPRGTDDCLRVARLSAPRRTLWRTCRDQVVSFSPDGRRMVTSGEGDDHRPPFLQVRRGDGRLLATYRARQFGFVEWESRRSVLLETVGAKVTAAVRCRPGHGCERASRLHQQPGGRPTQMDWSFPGES